MRSVLAAALSVLACVLSVAGGVGLSQPGASGLACDETGTNAVVSLVGLDAASLNIIMDVNAGNYSCAMLEFGTDVNGNGVLDRCEVDMAVGWDCGEWVCRDRRRRLVSAASRAPGRRRLDWKLFSNRGSVIPCRHEACDAGLLFQDMPADGLFRADWNLVRLVTRGGAPVEAVRVWTGRAPFVITVR